MVVNLLTGNHIQLLKKVLVVKAVFSFNQFEHEAININASLCRKFDQK